MEHIGRAFVQQWTITLYTKDGTMYTKITEKKKKLTVDFPKCAILPLTQPLFKSRK